MAKNKWTVKDTPKTVEIPLTLLRHLVRQTGNRQAKMFLIKAGGTGYKTAAPGANVIEPEIAKVEKKERAKKQHKASTKPTPEAKVEEQKKIDKVFKK